MKGLTLRLLTLITVFCIPIGAFAHPGGALIAVDANTVIFGDPMNNVLWRMEKGKPPQPLMTKLHVHWTTFGLDGRLYAESFGEMGGALFRIDIGGTNHVKVAEETDLNAHVFVVGKNGELIFQKGGQIVERATNGTVRPFRGKGTIAPGEAALGEVIAYTWTGDGTLYLSDGGNIRRIASDGVVRFIARVEGKLLDRQIWNSTGSPRVWGIAVNAQKRIYAALPDLGQVVRIDPDGSQHIIDRTAGGWRTTAVATFGDAVFLLESSDSTNAGQRVRVIRNSGPAEMLGQIAG